jgi:hypothetical protein
MQAASKKPYKSKLFPKDKNENKIPIRGLYQRYIISLLALNISSMTRRALAKPLAREFGVSMRGAYEHVMKELQECLIPDGIVEVADERALSVRGPRIFQTRGIPCYRLSPIGTLIAAALDEIDIGERKNILQHFLVSESALLQFPSKHNIRDEILDHLQKYPQFTLELVEKGVSQFLEGRLKYPLDIFLQRSRN